MSPVRLSDLPPNVRKKIAAGDARPTRSPGRSSASRVSGKSPGWRCAKCQQHFDTWAAAERHYHPSPTVPTALVGVLEVVR